MNGGDRLYRICSTDGLRGCIREAKVPNLAAPDQVLVRTRDIFDRHVGIHAVPVEEIDDVRLEAPQRRPLKYFSMINNINDCLIAAVAACKYRRHLPGGFSVDPQLEPAKDRASVIIWAVIRNPSEQVKVNRSRIEAVQWGREQV